VAIEKINLEVLDPRTETNTFSFQENLEEGADPQVALLGPGQTLISNVMSQSSSRSTLICWEKATNKRQRMIRWSKEAP